MGDPTFAEHMASIGWVLIYLIHYRQRKSPQLTLQIAHHILGWLMERAGLIELCWQGSSMVIQDGRLYDNAGMGMLDSSLNPQFSGILSLLANSYPDPRIPGMFAERAPKVSDILWAVSIPKAYQRVHQSSVGSQAPTSANHPNMES